jgi:hypothetical protein
MFPIVKIAKTLSLFIKQIVQKIVLLKIHCLNLLECLIINYR